MLFMGIDPGANGAIAVLNGTNPDGHVFVQDTLLLSQCEDQQIYQFIANWSRNPNIASVIVLEQVGGYIGGGGHPGSSMFNFGMRYGALRMALAVTGLREGVQWHLATPQKWQRGVGAPKGGNGVSKAEHKKHLVQYAQSKFPGYRVRNSTADALLIALYCRLTYGPKQ